MSMLSRACGLCTRAIGSQARGTQRSITAAPLSTSAAAYDEAGPSSGGFRRREPDARGGSDGRGTYRDRGESAGYRGNRPQGNREGRTDGYGGNQGGQRRDRNGGGFGSDRFTGGRQRDGSDGGTGFARSQGGGEGGGYRNNRGPGGQNGANRNRDGFNSNRQRDGASGDRPYRGGQRDGTRGPGGFDGNRQRRSEPSFGLQDPNRPRNTPRQPRFNDDRTAGDRQSPFSRRQPRGAEDEAGSVTEEDGLETESAGPPETAADGFSHARGARKPPTPHEGRPRQRTGSSTSYKALLADTQQELLLPGRNERRDRAKDKDPHHAHGSRRDAPGGRFHRSEGHSVAQENKGLKKKVQAKQIIEKQEKEVFIPSTVTVQRLAAIFGVKLYTLQTEMHHLGMSEDQRQPDHILTAEEACNLALERNLNPIIDDEAAFDIMPDPDPPGVVQPLRPPVVTIMGHVDHGKTTLLDALRNTAVAPSEAGGITQHIGAFSVPLSSLLPASSSASASSSDSTITFLDTPGHAAFTNMRARGASVTDIVVLVVAADDGVMPQTKEVLDLVKAEGDKVGLVVAINKCDKAGIDFDKVKTALGAEGILLEEDGGDTPAVRVSGLAKMGLDDLVETLSTLAELRDLRARTDGKAEGYILESRVDKGRGNVATVIVTKGTLRAGASVVAGTTWARVRQMADDKGKALREAKPGAAITITGWKELPAAGDQLLESVNGEDEAKKAVTNRLRDVERRKLLEDVEVINLKRAEERLRTEEEERELERIKAEGGDVRAFVAQKEREARSEAGPGAASASGKKELLLVIKGDVSGTVEAVQGSLEHIGNKEAGVKIIHTGVGEVSESDVRMAEAAGATVIGFSVPCSRGVQSLAASLNVPLHNDSVIYRLIDVVRGKVAALLPPIRETKVTGEATCQQVFEIKGKGKEVSRIAGCKVGNGVIGRNDGGVRVLRGKDREQVFEGAIDTLKHLKKDVTEVRKGTDCGISFVGWNDIKEGDEIVTFTTFEVPRQL